MKFLGNASAAIANKCRRQSGAFSNDDLKPLIDEDNRFKDAAPILFGKDS
jgi:hypothetical protein